jgi:hypothetical protein
MNLPRNYDAWRLSGPGESEEIGTDEGETCNRLPDPDEDAPRGYRPKRCNGTMRDVDEFGVCDTCGAMT